MDKLQRLAEIEGFSDSMDMVEEYVMECCVPSICMNEDCDYTTQMEPDQSEGWCEDCQANTVKSCLVLAGII